jgi:hypothetical protein
MAGWERGSHERAYRSETSKPDIRATTKIRAPQVRLLSHNATAKIALVEGSFVRMPAPTHRPEKSTNVTRNGASISIACAHREPTMALKTSDIADSDVGADIWQPKWNRMWDDVPGRYKHASGSGPILVMRMHFRERRIELL